MTSQKKSKTQVKKEAEALQKLGEELIKLSIQYAGLQKTNNVLSS
jgi:ribosomal 50S subunit-associated protein YjgA (DUF615 family)